MNKIIFIVISVIVGILVYNKNNEIIIPGDAIRVRIIANSNNIEDLYQKEKLKKEIKKDLYDLVKEASSSYEADNIIKNNFNNIKNLVLSKDKSARINYGLNYFPEKNYKGVIYPAGEYESLVITLGDGLGDNWWCVLYPPLCMIEENNLDGNVEYRLLVSDIINN